MKTNPLEFLDLHRRCAISLFSLGASFVLLYPPLVISADHIVRDSTGRGREAWLPRLPKEFSVSRN